MIRTGLAILITAAAFCLVQPVQGQDWRGGIIGSDDRRIVEEQGAPWHAVGQINVALYRMLRSCTGTLVAPDVVVTAAHCVIDPWKKQPYPARLIHFVAGVRNDTNKGHSVAKCLRFLPGYRFIGPEKILPTVPGLGLPLAAFSKDVIAVVLRNRLSIEPAMLARDVVRRPSLTFTHAAYPADRRHRLSAHYGCRLVMPEMPLLWMNDCDTHAASSGGPLFVEQRGALHLAAIMVGSGNRRANIALPISEWISLIDAPDCR